MKKYFLSLVAMAAAMLFATSCQESLVEPQIEGPTTFTVQLPDQMGTKAFGDAASTDATINRLYVQVYDESGDNSLVKLEPISVKTEGKAAFEFSLDLVRGAKYDIILWAQNENAKYNVGSADSDLRSIWMTDQHHNSELGAAFYAIINNYDPENDADRKQDVVLTRPFAQLNIGTELTSDHGELTLVESKVTVAKAAGKLERVAGEEYMIGTGNETTFTYTSSTNQLPTAEPLKVAGKDYAYVSMDYLAVLGDTKSLVDVTVEINLIDKFENPIRVERRIESVPVQMNYRTNIVGNLISSTTDFNVTVDEEWAGGYDVENGNVSTEVNVDSAEELLDAFENEEVDEIILNEDIDLNYLFNLTKSAESTEDPTLTIGAGRTLTIDLNGKILSATSSQSDKSYNMFDVCGTLTVKNGTIKYKHMGEDMDWNYYAEIFHLGFNGTLNLDCVTAINGGGSDMAYVIDMSNAENITVNVNESTLQSTYIPVRVFNNNKTGINNVNIKKSTLKGKYCFWVQYWLSDGYDKATLKNTVKLDIFNSDEEDNDNNKFEYDNNKKTPILAGYNEYVNIDAYGITKVVSEDGTEVTLGSLIEDGLVRRGDAGAEENTTIKKVVVEEGITTLYDRTFRRFYALEEVELPSTLKVLGANEDYYTSGSVFQGCSALKNIVIPEGVITIGPGAFYGCSSLTSINIPAGITRIERDALRETGLTRVEFPSEVTYFGNMALRDCKQLEEVIINAHQFTIESNTFGIMAAPFTPMTIYVANSEMKAYVESMLTAHDKTYISVVAPTEVNTTKGINEALAEGNDVVLTSDIAVLSTETGSNGYGATGISQLNGGVIDGNGYNISVDAWSKWDSAINTTGGTIKNLNVTGGMRGIFVNHNSNTYSGKVILENVTIDGTVYTISCDQGTNNGLEAYNSTFKGWTSYAATIGDVKFEDCSFGKGQGYAYCRPYAPTEFVNCAFAAGYELEAVAEVTFENCTIGGVALTAENLATLVIGGIEKAEVVK